MTAAKSMARGFTLYALSCVLLIGLACGVFTAIYGPAERSAAWISAVVAFVVQMLSFAIARMLADKGNGMAGWALGALICLGTLVVFGLVSRALGLPQTAALVSLATYFSLTELIEAPFLFL